MFSRYEEMKKEAEEDQRIIEGIERRIAAREDAHNKYITCCTIAFMGLISFAMISGLTYGFIHHAVEPRTNNTKTGHEHSE